MMYLTAFAGSNTRTQAALANIQKNGFSLLQTERDIEACAPSSLALVPQTQTVTGRSLVSGQLEDRGGVGNFSH